MENNNDKSLMALTVPIFFELLLVTIVGNIDIIMLGKYSDQAVGAVGGISQVLLMQNVIFSFICLGTTILTSQYIGAKKEREIKDVIGVSLVMNLIIALIIGGIYVAGTTFIFKEINLPMQLADIGRNYFKLVGGLCLFQALTLTCGAAMKAHGNTKEVLYINLGVNTLNIIGNGMFIFGWMGAPILGVTGVGLSTVTSRAIGCIVAYKVMSRYCDFKFDVKRIIKFPVKILKNILTIGIPTAGEHLCWSVAQMIILSFVNTMGEDTITARTYLTLIASFIMTFSIALGHGTAIQVGRLVGAGEKERVYHKCLKSTAISFVAATLVSAMVVLGKTQIMGIFTTDEKILSIAYVVFIWFLFIESGRTFNIVIISSLHAAGDIKFPAVMAMASMLGVAVPLSWFLGIKMGYGLIGIWIANGIDEWIRGFAMLLRWRGRKWMEKGFV